MSEKVIVDFDIGAWTKCGFIKHSVDVQQIYLKSIIEKNKNYEHNDARVRCFDKIVYALYVFQLNAALTCGASSPENLTKILKPFDYVPEVFNNADNHKRLLDVYGSHTIFLLLHSSFAAIESSIRIFIRSMDLPTAPKKIQLGTARFSQIYKRLIEELKIDSEYVTLLKLLSTMRNTIHNRGTFINENAESTEKITYKERDYHFVYGKQLEFATLEVILNLLIDIHQMLEDIVESVEIKRLSYIKDIYL